MANADEIHISASESVFKGKFAAVIGGSRVCFIRILATYRRSYAAITVVYVVVIDPVAINDLLKDAAVANLGETLFGEEDNVQRYEDARPHIGKPTLKQKDELGMETTAIL